MSRRIVAYTTSSPAVAGRPRDVSCLSAVIASIIQYVECDLLLLLTSASDLPPRTHKFCPVLFSLVYSLIRGDLCRKQTCTVTVIHYCTEDRQLLITHCSTHRSTASYSSKIVICAYTSPLFGDPLGGPCRNVDITFGTEKLEWCG